MKIAYARWTCSNSLQKEDMSNDDATHCQLKFLIKSQYDCCEDNSNYWNSQSDPCCGFSMCQAWQRWLMSKISLGRQVAHSLISDSTKYIPSSCGIVSLDFENSNSVLYSLRKGTWVCIKPQQNSRQDIAATKSQTVLRAFTWTLITSSLVSDDKLAVDPRLVSE